MLLSHVCECVCARVCVCACVCVCKRGRGGRDLVSRRPALPSRQPPIAIILRRLRLTFLFLLSAERKERSVSWRRSVHAVEEGGGTQIPRRLRNTYLSEWHVTVSERLFTRRNRKAGRPERARPVEGIKSSPVVPGLPPRRRWSGYADQSAPFG